MQAVWPDTFVEESNLTRNISVLRKALNRTDGEPQNIAVDNGHSLDPPMFGPGADAFVNRG